MHIRVLCAFLFVFVTSSTAARADAPKAARAVICPVHTGVIHSITPSLWSFDLTAVAPRTASGDIAVETNQGWFSVPFGPVVLVKKDMDFARPGGGTLHSNVARSPIEYVDFGRSVNPIFWFVEKTASVSAGEPAAISVACYPQPISASGTLEPLGDELLPYARRPLGSKTISALAIAPLYDSKCARSFADAIIVKQVVPAYPIGAHLRGVTSLIMVTILSDGSVGAAKVFRSSGDLALDNAALNAARQSQYTPRIVFCAPVEGDYLFKVTFN